MGGALFLILGILFVAYYLLRKFGGPGLARARGLYAPSLLSRLMLGPRQSLAVVRVLGKMLVLGVTESRITLLSETAAPDVEEPVPEEQSSVRKTFATILRLKRHETDPDNRS